MNPITIPKKMTKEDLVIIPRKEYETLLRVAKKAVSRKSSNSELDQALSQALREVKKGTIHGPFNTSDELLHSLE